MGGIAIVDLLKSKRWSATGGSWCQVSPRTLQRRSQRLGHIIRPQSQPEILNCAVLFQPTARPECSRESKGSLLCFCISLLFHDFTGSHVCMWLEACRDNNLYLIGGGKKTSNRCERQIYFEALLLKSSVIFNFCGHWIKSQAKFLLFMTELAFLQLQKMWKKQAWCCSTH